MFFTNVFIPITIYIKEPKPIYTAFCAQKITVFIFFTKANWLKKSIQRAKNGSQVPYGSLL